MLLPACREGACLTSVRILQPFPQDFEQALLRSKFCRAVHANAPPATRFSCDWVVVILVLIRMWISGTGADKGKSSGFFFLGPFFVFGALSGSHFNQRIND